MEWPYQSLRRQRLPPDMRGLNVAEYNFVDRPVRQPPAVREVQEAHQLRRQLVHAQLGREREGEPDDRHALRVGARAHPRRQDQLLGPRRVALRAATSSRPPATTATTSTGRSATRTSSRTTTRSTSCSGARARSRASTRCRTACSRRRRSSIAPRPSSAAASRSWGASCIPGRAGVTTDGLLNNKYRQRCMRRGRCGRGCDLNASFHSPAALIAPARDTGNMTLRPYSVVREVLLDESTNKARGVRVIDAQHQGGDGLHGTRRGARRRHARHDAHPAELEVGALPERARQHQRRARPLPERAHHGRRAAAGSSRSASARRRPSTMRDRSGPTSRASGTSAPTSRPTSSAATTSRAAAAQASTRATRMA